MAGNSVTELLQGRGDPVEMPSVVRGYVSGAVGSSGTLLSEPSAFPVPGSETNLLWVISPEYETTRPLGPCRWSADHGVALPAQYAKCVVAFDNEQVPTVVWWEGAWQGSAPTLVSSLPSSPADGDEVYFQAAGMAASGVAWHLRYREASASAHKWEFVGGPALYSEIVTTEIGESTVFAELATAGPSLTVPVAGDYDITIGAYIFTASTGVEGKMSYKIGAATASETDEIQQYAGGATVSIANPAGNLQRTRRKTGLAAVELLAQYKATAGKINFGQRWMSITPVRVG